jgi:hypothetical protein
MIDFDRISGIRLRGRRNHVHEVGRIRKPQHGLVICPLWLATRYCAFAQPRWIEGLAQVTHASPQTQWTKLGEELLEPDA